MFYENIHYIIVRNAHKNKDNCAIITHIETPQGDAPLQKHLPLANPDVKEDGH